MFCSNCGSQLEDNSKFCSKCGTPSKSSEISESTRSPEKKYDVVLTGEVIEGQSFITVKNSLVEKLNIDRKSVDAIFSSENTVIKKGVDEKTAIHYKEIFNSAGAECYIVSEKEVQIQNIKQENVNSTPINSTSSKKTKKKWSAIEILGVIFLTPFAILMIYVFINSEKSNTFLENPVAVYSAHEIIKNRLKFPDTFNNIESNVVWKGSTPKGLPAFIVKVRYNVENGLGMKLNECNIVSFFEENKKSMYNSLAGVIPCGTQPHNSSAESNDEFTAISKRIFKEN